MSDYVHPENKGALFNNSYKEKDNQPDKRGSINVEGKVFDIAAWINKDKNGQEYLSLSVQEPRQREDSKDEESKVVDEKPENDVIEGDDPF